MHPRSLPRFVLALSAAHLVTSAPVAQQPDYTGADTRMAWYQKHRAMTENTPFGQLPWQFLGPKNISGRVTDVAVGKRRGRRFTMFVAGASGGVWKTITGGHTWRPVFEQTASTSIGDVTIAPSDENVVWIGTGEANIFRSSMAGSGVYKSIDSGETWTHMGLAGTHTIPRIVIHPENPDIVYVAASGHEWTDNPERGVYKTTDGGKSWDRVLFIDEKTGVIDLVMHPGEPDTIYAATWQRQRKRWNDPRNEDGYSGSGIHKSIDGGKNWLPINKGLPDARWRGRIGIDLCRSKPNVVYAFVDNYELGDAPTRGRDSYNRVRTRAIKGAEIYRSDDSGSSWRKTSRSNTYMARHSSTYGWVFGQMRVDPTNPDVIYTMGLALHVSRNSGKRFKRLGQMHGDPRARIHGDHHALWIDPDDPKFLVNGNDGGADMSFDGGRTWASLKTHLPMVQFFNVNYDMDRPFRVYGSIQDHGSYRAIVDLRRGRDNIPAQDWQRAPGGEGSHHFIDPTDPNTVYSCGFYGSISRTDLSREGSRRGRRRRSPWLSESLDLPVPAGGDRLRGQWLAPFILSPHDPNVLYHGMNYLFRSGDRGVGMEVISPDLTYADESSMGDIPFHTISSISESPLERGEIYVGTDDGRVWVTKPGNKTWTSIENGIKAHRWISRLEASKFTEGTVYMAQNGKRHDDFTPYLWKSTNHGETWESIVNNIPIGPINVIREDPKNANILYVGTDLGVYISTDGGGEWNSVGRGLPSTFVSDLIIHPRDDIIVISTHGRGMYAMDATALRRRVTAIEPERKDEKK